MRRTDLAPVQRAVVIFTGDTRWQHGAYNFSMFEERTLSQQQPQR